MHNKLRIYVKPSFRNFVQGQNNKCQNFGGYSCIYDILLIHYNFSRGGGETMARGGDCPLPLPLK